MLPVTNGHPDTTYFSLFPVNRIKTLDFLKGQEVKWLRKLELRVGAKAEAHYVAAGTSLYLVAE